MIGHFIRRRPVRECVVRRATPPASRQPVGEVAALAGLPRLNADFGWPFARKPTKNPAFRCRAMRFGRRKQAPFGMRDRE